MLGNQSKWIGALVGYIVGALISGLATIGLATCGVEGDISTCAIMGMDAATWLAQRTATRTSPCWGSGVGSSVHRRASGPIGLSQSQACMVCRGVRFGP